MGHCSAIRLNLPFILYVDSIVCELGAPVLKFPIEHYKTFYNDQKCIMGDIIEKNNILMHESCSDQSIETMLPWLEDDCGGLTVCSLVVKDGLAKGGSLPLQWLSAADSWGTGVRHIGRQDTATWQAGPNCHRWFLQSGLKTTLLISVSLLSQEYRKEMLHFWKCNNDNSVWPHNEFIILGKKQNAQIFCF